MEIKEIKKIIKEELPKIIQTDEEIARFVIQLSSQYYAGKIETENRFDRVLKEIQKNREEQNKKWEEHQAEDRRKWDEQNRKWEEQNRKWEENQKIIREIFEEIKVINRKHDQTIGALGARWGLHSEAAFRNALSGILEDSFKVHVMHINEFDEKGEVFGQPDQVELDVLIQNGILIICEIKSSMSKPDMHAFIRKIKYYENRHECKANRKIVISPMIDERAKVLADKMGIEIYSYADDVKREN